MVLLSAFIAFLISAWLWYLTDSLGDESRLIWLPVNIAAVVFSLITIFMLVMAVFQLVSITVIGLFLLARAAFGNRHN